MDFPKLTKRNILMIAIGFLFFIILGIVGLNAQNIYETYQKKKIEKQLEKVYEIIKIDPVTRESCVDLFEIDREVVQYAQWEKAKTIRARYDSCHKKYDIEFANLDYDFCSGLIVGTKSDFADRYLLLDSFHDIQTQCSLKFLTVTFSTGALFDVEHDFKSVVNIDFGLPFYEDTGERESEAFLENRIAAKQRLIDILKISPGIHVDIDDIVLYPKKAIIYMNLAPKTEYTFSLKEYESRIEGEAMTSESFVFTTPENKYFGIRTDDKVTLFRDTQPPSFELVSYDSGKQNTTLKICRIANEQYAKIEVFAESGDDNSQKNTFFKEGIDAIPTLDCVTKNLTFSGDDVITDQLSRKSFTLDAEIGEVARSGLYYMTFEIPQDRNAISSRVQQPLFFGIIDSHVTMKVGKNGEAFFFVNDFDGKPLSGQQIRVDTNEFISKKSTWNREKKESEIEYFSPLEQNVFGTGFVLGTTNTDGILQINLKDKIEDAFAKTAPGWNFDYEGNHNSFFVTSSSASNLSYVSSKWNGGIGAWNFGYTLGGGWWYGDSQNADNLSLNTWSQAEPQLYTHTFTDRKLYLPGEEVYLKSIVRNSSDLSIPKGKKLTLKILDPKREELVVKDVTINEFGSLSDTLELQKDAHLGSYYVSLMDGDTRLGNTDFSVEIFKNPKFQNDIGLTTKGLEKEVVKITSTDVQKTSWGYTRETYFGDFSLSAVVNSNYYSGAPVGNANFTYKVYKQYYYDNDYWSNCYYGCYWEPEKELYTEGAGQTDENGKSLIDIPVKFESSYSDYKYIVEVTVIDQAGDKISGTNSIIARLPTTHKRWDNNNSIYFKTEKRFYESGSNITLDGGLSVGDFTADYADKFLLIIKKKEYNVSYVEDVRGQSRPITSVDERVEEILSVNAENFSVTSDGKLKLKYQLKETGEYIFEFGKINTDIPYDSNELISEFLESGKKSLSKTFSGTVDMNYNSLYSVYDHCDGDDITCSYQPLIQETCGEKRITKECREKTVELEVPQIIYLTDIMNSNSRKYFTIVSYGDEDAKNPVESDNKITVLGEKVSYKLGETARVLVRLPFSKGKILWTVEKQGVVESEYIDVPGNIFFKEVEVDDTFVPNAYIGIVAVDTNHEKVPQYKVGYTEIVVDKTDKKSEVAITPNKKTYEPRERVTLDIAVKNANDTTSKSELTVMVVDDSLISLMGNIDLNVLEKIYKKLPFQIQTSITNIAMLRNYYFSRQGIVGGSGFGNFKGGDSAVSSRNIFKNTAYYNAGVITDTNGKARVTFTLPDNLTNFRVMVISQSSDNFFGYSEEMIEVRKEVIVEDKTPQILRYGDSIEIGANVFNATDTPIGFTATLKMEGIEITDPEKIIAIEGGKSEFITWNIKNTQDCLFLDENCHIPYSISILGDSVKHSDKIEGSITIAPTPMIIQDNIVSADIRSGKSADLSLQTTQNTNKDKSIYKLSVSNDPFLGIEDIFKSLARYPYGCIEQTLSSTLPNANLKRLSALFTDMKVKPERIDRNLDRGLERILSMQLENGGFGYWQGDSFAELAITPYVLRTLVQLRDAGVEVPEEVLENTQTYLIKHYENAPEDVQLEILWALSQYKKSGAKKIFADMGISDISKKWDVNTLNYHSLLTYTYTLFYTDATAYKQTIDSAIALLIANEPLKNYYSYYSDTEDIALLTQLLIDYNYDSAVVTDYVVQLYRENWKSYWYSTKAKNAAFLAFTKYMETYGSEYQNTANFTLNGNSRDLQLDSENGLLQSVKQLTEVLSGEKINLEVINKEGIAPLFVTSDMQIYPLDPLKVEPYSHEMRVTRTIYEVTDESDIEETCTWSQGNRTCIPAKGLKLHTSDEFKKGTTYKVRLTANFDSKKSRENLTIEDYLPAGFSVLNSRFKTNSIATSQATTGDRWRWSHTEKRPEGVMAHARYSWGSKAEYEYFVRAEFAGEFIYPPVVAYMMYQPEIRANGEFRRVVIK